MGEKGGLIRPGIDKLFDPEIWRNILEIVKHRLAILQRRLNDHYQILHDLLQRQQFLRQVSFLI